MYTSEVDQEGTAWPAPRESEASSRGGRTRRNALFVLLIAGTSIPAACVSTEGTTTTATAGRDLGAMVESFQPDQVAVDDGNPGGVVNLVVSCDSRDDDGNCTEASCQRELNDVEPGFETDNCAAFLVGCADAGHTATGNENNATCKATSS